MSEKMTVVQIERWRDIWDSGPYGANIPELKHANNELNTICDLALLGLQSSDARERALEEFDRALCLAANEYHGGINAYYMHGLWKAREILSALKNNAAQAAPNAGEQAIQAANYSRCDGEIKRQSATTPVSPAPLENKNE